MGHEFPQAHCVYQSYFSDRDGTARPFKARLPFRERWQDESPGSMGLVGRSDKSYQILVVQYIHDEHIENPIGAVAIWGEDHDPR